MNAPLGPQPIPGRIFGSDWTIANVAKLLRFNAGQDFVRVGPLTGGMRDISDSYHRKTSARHLPSGVTVTFRRDITGNWHAELCFSGLDHYLPWNDALAEEWLAALFLHDRPRVLDVTLDVTPDFTPDVTEDTHKPGAIRHFKLAV